MATLYADAYLNGVVFRATHDAPTTVQATYKVAAGKTLAANDVIKMFKLGAGMEVLELTLKTSDLDDGTDMTLDVGDNTTVDCFLDGSTICQTGGVERAENGGDNAFADAPYVVRSATSDIQIKVLGTATQSTVDDADRYISLTVKFQKEKLNTRSSDPYTYGV